MATTRRIDRRILILLTQLFGALFSVSGSFMLCYNCVIQKEKYRFSGGPFCSRTKFSSEKFVSAELLDSSISVALQG